MPRFGVVGAVVFALSSGALASCGGGGHGYTVAANPVVITSNALPPTLSGQVVNHCIPFEGGAGGPYILELIDGEMPDGVVPDSATVCLVGQALEDGVFDFTLKLTDTGSRPFTTSIVSFHWEIGIGSLVFGTDPVLPPMVFNQFGSISLTVAGGIGPYSCDVVDDPDNPDDEPLPNGLVIPSPSCTIVGAPIGIKSIAPFIYKVSIRATDSSPVPQTVVQEFTLTVLVPPLVIVTTSIANGKCGATYLDGIVLSGGIPPFKHQVVDAVSSTTVLRGDGASNNAVPKGTATSAYALDTTAGPYTGKFPEGLYLRDTTGGILGVPRRQGTFNNWIYWASSLTLPSNPTQNQWRAFSFSMADGVPPSVVLGTSVLLPGNTFSSANNFLPDADATKPYSRQFTVTGGVPFDGFSDAAVESDRVGLPPNVEAPGQMNWSHSIVGVPSLATVGMTFTLGGELRGTGPSKEVGSVRTGFLTLTVTADDLQLPLPTAPTHKASGTCRFSIGPDVVIVTEGLAAHTPTTVNSTFAPLGSYNHVSFEYNDQNVTVFEPFVNSAMVVRPLASGDLTSSHNALPAAIDTLLTGVDMQPITVNPTWWAYDVYNLNPRGARALQHADLQRMNNGEGYNADANTSSSMSAWNFGADTFERNGDACIELPDASNVPGVPAGTADKPNGVYANGGQLRAFDGGTYLGFFVVRKDAKVYVPWAIDKVAEGIEGFGDAVQTSNRAAPSVFRRLQISVSPDGRFAAVKLKPDVDNFAETSGSEKILVFSLTGEKVFPGGQTWRTMTTGGTGTTSDGQYLYGDSLTLTNNALYFLKGNNIGTNSFQFNVIYQDHWVYRCSSLTAAVDPALLAPNFGGIGAWTNDANAPLSTAYHRWAPPGSTAHVTSPTSSWTPSPGVGALTTGNPTKQAMDTYAYNFANFAENSCAPMPFRVSADGRTVAIVAANGVTAGVSAAQTSTANFLSWSIYTDFFDAGSSAFSFREATLARRRFAGGTRLAGARPGDYQSQLYGHYQGPPTQLELSDNGLVLAAVYNVSTASWSTSGSSNASNSPSREDVLLVRAIGVSTDPWVSLGETFVTGGPTPKCVSHNFRFGCLAFTRDASTAAGALVFWGGSPLGGATSVGTVTQASMLSGTLFQHTISTGTLQNILVTADGGHAASISTFTAVSPFGSTIPTNWDGTNRGSIMPIGYFISPDGRFLYLETLSPLVNGVSASGTPTTAPNDATTSRLIGVNVFDTATTINGKLPIRGFAVGGPWPTDPTSRGFGPHGGSSSSWNPNQNWAFGSGNWNQRVQQAVSAFGTNGTVFFAAYQQNNSWASTSDGTTSFSGGGPTNNATWNDASQYSGDIYAFNANVGGGVANITNLGNGTSTSRIISYMQPNVAGNRVAFVTTQSNTTSFATRFSDREQVRAVTNVVFNAAGALSTVPSVLTIEGANGRAGPSMSWDSTDLKVYYAFGTAAGNENAMSLKEVSFNSAGTSLAGGTNPRIQSVGASGVGARFSVLHAAR